MLTDAQTRFLTAAQVMPTLAANAGRRRIRRRLRPSADCYAALNGYIAALAESAAHDRHPGAPRRLLPDDMLSDAADAVDVVFDHLRSAFLVICLQQLRRAAATRLRAAGLLPPRWDGAALSAACGRFRMHAPPGHQVAASPEQATAPPVLLAAPPDWATVRVAIA